MESYSLLDHADMWLMNAGSCLSNTMEYDMSDMYVHVQVRKEIADL